MDLNGFAGFGGFQAGFNHQFGGAIIGMEADVSWSDYDMDRTLNDTVLNYVAAELDWMASLRGRLGVTAGNGMANVTAGPMLAYLEHCALAVVSQACRSDGSDEIDWSGVIPDFVAGMGVEAAIASHCSFRAEYLFSQTAIRNVLVDPGPPLVRDIDFSNRSHLFRIGLNYRFGSPL